MTTNREYEVMVPEDIHRMCGEGDGPAIGLPDVLDDKLDDVIMLARRVWETHGFDCGCLVCELYMMCCPECGQYVPHIPEDDEDHVITFGAVLIGCEGFHTAAFRAAQFADLEADD